MSYHNEQRRKLDMALAPFLSEIDQASLLLDMTAAVIEAIDEGTLKIGGRLVQVRELFAASHWSGTPLCDQEGKLVYDLEEGSDVVYDSEGQYATGLKQPVRIYLPVPDP